MENYWPSLDMLLIVGILLGPLIWIILAMQKRKKRTGEGDVKKAAIKRRFRLKPLVAGFIIMFTTLSIIYLVVQ